MTVMNIHTPSRPLLFKVLIATAAVVLAGQARAADPASDASLLGDKVNVNLGLGMGVVPRYMGADEYRSQMLPMFTVQSGMLFADSLRGLGLQYQSPSGFGASAALNYDFGRTEKNSTNRPGSNELKGMGTVGGATVADLMLSQQLLPWLTVSGEARTASGRREARQSLPSGL